MASPAESMVLAPGRLPRAPAGVTRALVVGAGIAGSAVANCLQRCGVDVDVVEKRQDHSAVDGAGVLLPANAIRAITRLGYGEPLAEAMLPVPGVVLADNSGRPLASVDWSQQAFSSGTIRHSVLRDILAGPEAGSVMYGVTATEFDTRLYRASLSNGLDQAYDLILGADGVVSSVRQTVFADALPTPLADYAGYRFVIPSQWHLDRPHYLLGNGRTLLLVPLPNGELYCGAGPIDRTCLAEGAGPLDTIRRTYADFGGIAAEVIASLDDSTTFIPSSFWNVAELRWARGRFALLGDAAHATVPTLAQGCAMALEDVVVLMESLLEHPDVEAALRAYALRRDPRARLVQHQSLRRMAGTRFVGDRHVSTARFALAARFGAIAMSRTWQQLASDMP